MVEKLDTGEMLRLTKGRHRVHQSISPWIFFFVLVYFAITSVCVSGAAYVPPWHLDRLDQYKGVDLSPFVSHISARTRPVLYVIDTGVNREHLEFSRESCSVISGYNFVDDSWDSEDCMGHGTHVAALAAGSNFGVAGSIGVDIIAVRILDCFGRGSCSSMIRGLEWVHQNHSAVRADVPGVVVMSIGSRQEECKGVNIIAEALAEKNIIIVAAAGNSAADACIFHPASAKGAITVGAIELRSGDDSAWSKTNFGECVDIFAPGVSIESAWPGSPYNNATKVLSGTSMAAPLVAGQALLIVAAIPGINVETTRQIIEQSASRGTLFGSQINPDAIGSRVARVPWLEAGMGRAFKINYGANSSYSQNGFPDNDTIVTAVQTYSITDPAMQYMVNSIASDLYNSIMDHIAQNGVFKLVIECGKMQLSESKQYRDIQHASARHNRLRGWDIKQQTESAGLRAFNVICNVTCSPGKGKALKKAILTAFNTGRVQNIFGESVSLLSHPVLTTSRTTSLEKSITTWKLLIIISIVSLIVLVAISIALVKCRRQRRRKRKRRSVRPSKGTRHV